MNHDYKKKYLKYKLKYFESSKNLILGGNDNNSNHLIKGIAYFDGINIKGTVRFEEIDLDNHLVKITINLTGFEPNTSHGFHVHEYGDLSSGCDSACAHFNPFNKPHGGRDGDGTNKDERHVGDLGNIIADSSGNVLMEFTDHLIKLRGDKANIIGRGLVIHADPDDCGKGSHPTSKTTGNSGKRIGCAVIGLASNCV
jgi:Cu-Zn family superoxide dismutase